MRFGVQSCAQRATSQCVASLDTAKSMFAVCTTSSNPDAYQNNAEIDWLKSASLTPQEAKDQRSTHDEGAKSMEWYTASAC
jgi:hypothetical protein